MEDVQIKKEEGSYILINREEKEVVVVVKQENMTAIYTLEGKEEVELKEFRGDAKIKFYVQ